MTQGPRRNGRYLPTKGSSNGQGRNGGDEGRDDKWKFGNSKYDFEDKREEESDTEDSCELEITPQQLSQVVPGGGVLKIKLSKKKPIKITPGVPDGEPDPAQTKVKTVHDLIDRKNGQPSSGLKPGVVFGAEQPKEKKIPPERVRHPMLGMGKGERLNIPPRRTGGPDGSGNRASGRDGDPLTIVIAQMRMEDLVGMATLQIGEEEDLLERMEIQMEEMEVLTLMIVGMGMILHPHQTPHCPEEEDIEDPNIFMYCKGHQARKGNLDNLDRQGEMAEMGKPCH